MTAKVYYLISSSASREYVADCLEAIALPRGSIQHFRYRRKHLSQEVRSGLPEKPTGLGAPLKDSPVMVVFLAVSRDPDDAWERAGDYIPLRQGRLVDGYFEGDIAHIFFEVLGYPKYPNEDRSTGPHTELTSVIRAEYPGEREKLRPYVLPLTAISQPSSEEEDARAFQLLVENGYVPGEWRTLTAGRNPLDITYEIVFYRISGVFKEASDASGSVMLTEVTPSLRSVPGLPYAEYELEEQSFYRIKAVTHLHRSLGPAQLPGDGTARLALQVDQRRFETPGTSDLRIASPYDLHFWSVVPTASGQPSCLRFSCTETSHRATPTDGFVRREFVSAEVSLPVRIVPSPGGH